LHANALQDAAGARYDIVPYFGLWFLMVRTVQCGYPYALTLLLAVVAGFPGL